MRDEGPLLRPCFRLWAECGQKSLRDCRPQLRAELLHLVIGEPGVHRRRDLRVRMTKQPRRLRLEVVDPTADRDGALNTSRRSISDFRIDSAPFSTGSFAGSGGGAPAWRSCFGASRGSVREVVRCSVVRVSETTFEKARGELARGGCLVPAGEIRFRGRKARTWLPSRVLLEAVFPLRVGEFAAGWDSR
jgi:hypothetical protein